MTSTLDNIDNNINIKIDAIIKLIDFINIYFKENHLNSEIVEIKNISKLYDEILNIKNNYTLETINIIKEFYQNEDEFVKKQLYNKFISIFHALNITGCIKRIYNYCNKIRKKHNLFGDEVQEIIKSYDYAYIEEIFEDVGSEMCKKCNILYQIDEKTSSFKCMSCGCTEKMYGVVFEDEQFFYQEGQRTKHGKYDPIKHAKFWTDRIQAKEITDIPERIINKIKRCIRADQLWIDQVSCETIRYYLKQQKITQYNNHIPLIRKIITGKEPPQFSDYEIRLLYMYFGTVIQIFNKIKGIEKSNCPYHPYFIYKIIEQILITSKDYKRKNDILSCIHLQSRDTLIENDKIWFVICDHIPEFTKIATDNNRSYMHKF
jgi:hypothetical protein